MTQDRSLTHCSISTNEFWCSAEKSQGESSSAMTLDKIGDTTSIIQPSPLLLSSVPNCPRRASVQEHQCDQHPEGNSSPGGAIPCCMPRTLHEANPGFQAIAGFHLIPSCLLLVHELPTLMRRWKYPDD